MKKLIQKVTVDQSNLVAAGQTREIFVFGEVESEFILNVIKINGTGKESYYNFKTKTFTEVFISANNLHVKMFDKVFSTLIIFPADSNGEVYSIKTIAKEQTTKFSNGNFVDVKRITQVGQTTLFLQVPDDFNSDSKLTTLPNPVQTTGSTALTSVVSVPVSFTFTNALSDAKGFGLRLPNIPVSNEFVIPDSFWYVQQAVVLDGTQSSVTTLNVDSTANIVQGMELAGVFDGVNKIFVTNVSEASITFSAAVSGSDNATIVLRAYGPALIKSVFGIEAEFSGFIARGTAFQKQVRSATTFPTSNGNVTLNLNGTYGVGGGGKVRLTGFNTNSVGNNNLITTVEASSTAGHVVINYAGAELDSALVIPIGTKLDVIGSHQVVTISGDIKIKKYPETNAKIVLDVPSIITVGTADE